MSIEKWPSEASAKNLIPENSISAIEVQQSETQEVESSKVGSVEFDRRVAEWDAEKRRILGELSSRIDVQSIKEDFTQRLEAKGLYEKDENGSPKFDERGAIYEILVDRETSLQWGALADELPEGMEKRVAQEMSGDIYGYTVYVAQQVIHLATQGDRASERYNGKPTTQNIVNALETLLHFGVISNNEFEVEKEDALRDYEDYIREAQD